MDTEYFITYSYDIWYTSTKIYLSVPYVFSFYLTTYICCFFFYKTNTRIFYSCVTTVNREELKNYLQKALIFKSVRFDLIID